MPREITVLLKQPESAPKPASRKFWNTINDMVKSPLFVFIFGASIGTIYPAIKTFLTPTSELESQRIQEEARADAALIVPFLANLSATEPGKFQASMAALKALETASKTSMQDKERPVFTAVNKAIEAVAKEIRPPTDKGALTESLVKKIDNDAKPAAAVPGDLNASYSRLQSALVYIQVDKNDKDRQAVAEKVRKNLRENSVVAPGIEKLDGNKIPAKTQVRYFNDADLSKAEDLAAVVSHETKLKVYVVKPNLPAKEGTLEIWIGKDAE